MVLPPKGLLRMWSSCPKDSSECDPPNPRQPPRHREKPGADPPCSNPLPYTFHFLLSSLRWNFNLHLRFVLCQDSHPTSVQEVEGPAGGSGHNISPFLNLTGGCTDRYLTPALYRAPNLPRSLWKLHSCACWMFEEAVDQEG